MIAAALKLAGLLLERVIGVANEILSGRNFNVIVVGIKLFETSVAIRMIASHMQLSHARLLQGHVLSSVLWLDAANDEQRGDLQSDSEMDRNGE